jgi:hypothetical protein
MIRTIHVENSKFIKLSWNLAFWQGLVSFTDDKMQFYLSKVSSKTISQQQHSSTIIAEGQRSITATKSSLGIELNLKLVLYLEDLLCLFDSDCKCR